MPDAPATLEGWYTLHAFYSVDWGRWNALAAGDRHAIVGEATRVLERLAQPVSGHGAYYTVLSQKADLCLMQWRPNLEELRAAEVAFDRTRLREYLVPSYSYLAVVELGTYELMAQAAKVLERKGPKTDDPGYEQALQDAMHEIARPRLYATVPPGRYLCFYPMSKRRGEQVNWYDMSAKERGEMMRGHGTIGRKYAGKVVQVIQGSVGFDDWEWGVSLFADDPLVFKKLIYEMRFDPASSRFALFGPFYVGLRIAPSELGAALEGRAPAAR